MWLEMTQKQFFIYYFVILAVCILIYELLRFIKHRSDKGVTMFFIIIISWLMGNRPFDVADTQVYYNVWNRMITYGDISFLSNTRIYNMEVLFVYLMKISREMSVTFPMFMCLVAFIIYVSGIYSINKIVKLIYKKEKDDYLLCLILFMSYFGIHYGGIAVRAGLSISLGLLAFSFYLENKYIKAALLFVVSFLFHTVGLLWLVIVVLWHIKDFLKLTRYWAIWLIIFILMLTNLSGRFTQLISRVIQRFFGVFRLAGFSNYLNNFDFAVGKKDLLICFSFGFLMLIVHDNIKENNKFLKVVLAGLVILGFLYPIRAITRAVDYFFVLAIVPSVNYLEKRKLVNKGMLVYKIATCSLLVVFAILQVNNCYK